MTRRFYIRNLPPEAAVVRFDPRGDPWVRAIWQDTVAGGGDGDYWERLVARHQPGKHDQKTHGHGGGSIPGHGYAALAAQAQAGGFTVNLRGQGVRTGYVVSPSKATEKVIPASEFNARKVYAYKRQHADELAKPNHYLGAWREGDSVYLDVSVRTRTKAEASTVAKAGDQLAYFDVANGVSIKVGSPEDLEGRDGKHVVAARPERGRADGGGVRQGRAGRGAAAGAAGAGAGGAARHLAGKHDQKTHGKGGTGFTALGDAPMAPLFNDPIFGVSVQGKFGPVPVGGLAEAQRADVQRAVAFTDAHQTPYNPAAVEASVAKFQDKYRDAPVETAGMVMPDGAVLTKGDGQTASVDQIPGYAMEHSQVFIHNHPSSYPYSQQDMSNWYAIPNKNRDARITSSQFDYTMQANPQHGWMGDPLGPGPSQSFADAIFSTRNRPGYDPANALENNNLTLELFASNMGHTYSRTPAP